MLLSVLRLGALGALFGSTVSALSVDHLTDRVTNSVWTPYNVGEGYRGVCGRFIYPSEFGVALSVEDFQPALCNRIVSLRYGDKRVYSQILDVVSNAFQSSWTTLVDCGFVCRVNKCSTCAKGNINITERLFKHFSSDLSTPLIGEWYLDNESDRV